MNLVILLQAFGASVACEKCSVLFKGGKTGEYDIQDPIFVESEIIKRGSEEGRTEGRAVSLVELERDVFEDIAKLLKGDADGMPDIGGEPLCQLMAGAESLRLSEKGMSTAFRSLAQKSLGGEHVRSILGSRMEGSFVSKEAYLWLLRAYGWMYNMSVCVDGDTATMHPKKGDGYGSGIVMKKVRILPPAFDKLLKGQKGGTRAAGPSEEEKMNGWDVVIWILMHMEISKLELDECKVGGHVAPISRLSTLRILSLVRKGDRDGLQPRDIQAISEIKGLTKLIMKGYAQVNLRPLSTMESLEVLDVSKNTLGGGTIQEISEIKSLVKLIMDNCVLGQASLRPLTTMPKLQALCASNNTLNDDMILIISEIKGLRMLIINNCVLKRVNLEPLSAMVELVMLDVSHNGLRDNNIQAISKINGLKKLRMTDCKLDEVDIGQKQVNLEPLKNLMNLLALGVSENTLSDGMIKVISEIGSLVILRMHKCNLDRVSLGPLSALINLRRLEVNDNTLSDGKIQELSRIKSIVELIMVNCTLDKVELEPLSTMPKLRVLDVTWNNINADGIKVISTLGNLKNLRIYICDAEQASFTLLKDLTELEVLDISGTKLSDSMVMIISEIVSIVELVMKDCGLDRVSLELLGAMPRLEVLDVGKNALSGGNIQEIITFGNLKKLRIYICGPNQVSLKPLGTMLNLKELDGSGDQLRENDIPEMATLIAI